LKDLLLSKAHQVVARQNRRTWQVFALVVLAHDMVFPEFHDQIGDTSTGNQVSLGSWTQDRLLIAAIPEPSTAVMGLLAVLAVAARRRR
jgi:hypothetical protein